MKIQKPATAPHGILRVIGPCTLPQRGARPSRSGRGWLHAGRSSLHRPPGRARLCDARIGGSMRRVHILTIAAAMIAAPVIARAQAQPAAPQTFTLSGNGVRGYQNIQRNLLEAAEKMPEADYAFK